MLTPYLRDGGRIVFLSTGLTRFVANPVYSVYAAMKDAIEVHTTYAAKSLGSRAITVNALAPGATATDFGGGMIRDDDDYRPWSHATTPPAESASPPTSGPQYRPSPLDPPAGSPLSE